METSLTSPLIDRMRSWPWREALVIAVVPVVLGLALWAVHQESLLTLLHGWLRMRADDNDSWGPMKSAIDYVAVNHAPIYQQLFFKQQLKFQYPPTSLLFHQLLLSLNVDPTPALLNKLNGFLILANGAMASWFGVRLARQGSVTPVSAYGPVPVAVLCFGAAVCFYPIMRAYTLGQAQIWIDVLFTATCLAWFYGMRQLAGALIGLICLVKPQFSLFFLWGMVRGEWQFVYGWAAVVLSGIAVSLHLFGLSNHLDYLTVLSSLSKTGESFHANQSINGLLNRLLANGPVTDWAANSFPPYNALVRWGTLLSSGGIIAGALLYRRRQQPGLLDFQLAALAFTIASPIAWEHHYGILPCVYIAAYFALRTVHDGATRKLCYWTLAASFVLTANYLGTSQALTRPPWNLLYSYLFFGAVALLLTLVFLTRSAVAGWRGWAPLPERPPARAADL